MLQDLHIGAPVLARDGRTLGELARVVVDPGHQVTHLVVDPGLVESGNLLEAGGWEKPRERVLPVALVEHVGPERIQLSLDEAEFQAQPLFERREYHALDVTDAADQPDQAHWWSRFRLGELVDYVASGFGLGAAPYIAPADITYNESPGSMAIGEGTPVWRQEPHEHLGEVERVLTSGDSATITALVLRRQGIRGEHVVLPIAAVVDLSGDTVHVRLSDQELASLRPYTPSA
jgi:uncharacterized protein YrrD